MVDSYMNRAGKLAVLALAGMVAACTTGTVVAGHARRTGMQIDVSDLDLRTNGGQLALHHRIVLAARKVCGPTEFPGQVAWDVYRMCLREAMDGAAPQVLSLVGATSGNAKYAEGSAPNR